MSDRVEQAFANLRRGPWNASPLGVPQEGPSGNGNIDSQGWLADGSVTADVIQANAVIAGKIDADAVTAREIAAATITANEIAANTITGAKIAANTITAANIAADTITANEIAANTITAAEIAADSITTNELAANAVITENILAANVTSSRIELTVSGKNFGANSGSKSSPGIFFDAASSKGLSWDGNFIVLGTGNTGTNPYVGVGSTSISLGAASVVQKEPGGIAADLGASNNRWSTIYLVNTPNVSSDARIKKDIADETLGLEFVRSLRPRTFRYRSTEDTQARELAAVDAESLERERRPHADRIAAIRAKQLSGEMGDDEAEGMVEQSRAALAAIEERHALPLRRAAERTRPGRRVHHGLIAQEVKQALDAAGVDAAFWTEGPDGTQALAHTELIAPMLRAIQELADRVDGMG